MPSSTSQEHMAGQSRHSGSTGTSGSHTHSSQTSGNTGQGQTVQLHEEELRTNKQQVQAGEVQIRKEVVTEQQSRDVPVMREEAVIERHPVERRRAEGEIGSGNETIRVPLREEQVTVEKVPVVTEEISVGKRQTQETQQVSGQVRREEARIENQGGSVGSSGSRWEDAMPSYRSSWEQQHGAQGGQWEQYEPAYRYGHEMSSNPRYQGRSWQDVEPDLQSNWGTQHRETPWERVKDTIRSMWGGSTHRR